MEERMEMLVWVILNRPTAIRMTKLGRGTDASPFRTELRFDADCGSYTVRDACPDTIYDLRLDMKEHGLFYVKNPKARDLAKNHTNLLNRKQELEKELAEINKELDK